MEKSKNIGNVFSEEKKIRSSLFNFTKNLVLFSVVSLISDSNLNVKNNDLENFNLLKNISEIEKQGPKLFFDSIPPVNSEKEERAFSKIRDSLEMKKALISLKINLQKLPPKLVKKIKETYIVDEIIVLNTESEQKTFYDVGGYHINHKIALEKNGIDYAFPHEFFHCIDKIKDNIWSTKLYGKNYKKYYGKLEDIEYMNINKKNKIPDGFISLYGQRNPAEDKATIAEYLLKGRSDLDKAISKDKTLQKKFKFMKDFLLEMSDGLMDDQYWQDLKNGIKIDSAYWTKKQNHIQK